MCRNARRRLARAFSCGDLDGPGAAQITGFVATSAFLTLEALGAGIARHLCVDLGIAKVTVRVGERRLLAHLSESHLTHRCAEKPDALRKKGAEYAAVELTRSRANFAPQPGVSTTSSGSSVAGSRDENGDRVVFIALGSNLGNRAQNIEAALRELESSCACRIVDTGMLYDTPPAYVLDQVRFPEPAGHPLRRLFGSHRLLRLRAAHRCIQRLLPGNTPGCSRTEASTRRLGPGPGLVGRPALLFGPSADGRSFGSRRSSTVVKATATLDRACHASMLHVACHRPSVHGVHVAAAVPQHGRQGVDHRRASRTAPPPQGRRGSLGPRLGERPPVRLNVPTWPVACSRRYGACCALPRNKNNTT